MRLSWKQENLYGWLFMSLLRLAYITEPAHEIMLLITQAMSTTEGSGEPAHLQSFARAFAVGTHEVWK